jgi:hypothetical protein
MNWPGCRMALNPATNRNNVRDSSGDMDLAAQEKVSGSCPFYEPLTGMKESVPPDLYVLAGFGFCWFRRTMMCRFGLGRSLMLRCGLLRRALCVRRNSLVRRRRAFRTSRGGLMLGLCSRSRLRSYRLDLGAGRFGFCGWLSGTCRVVCRRRRSSMFGLCRRFCSWLVLSRPVLGWPSLCSLVLL